MNSQLVDRWLPMRFVAVVDTDVLLANLVHQARFNVLPRLVRAAGDGTVRMFAANHVYFETYDKLVEVAGDVDVDVEVLKELFEREHLPMIKFVTTPEDVTGRSSTEVTDSADIPTAQLAGLVAPCVLFSRDRHLRNPGLAPQDWLQVAQAAVHAGESDRRESALGMTIYAPTAGVVLLTKWVGKRLGVSPWLLGGGVAAWIAGLLRDPEHRRVAGQWFMRAADVFWRVVKEGEDLQAAGLHELSVAAVPEPERPSTTHVVARVLAWAPEPLLAGEIAHLGRELPGGQGLDTERVRATLASTKAFVRRQHARWELGRMAGPLNRIS